MNRPSGIRNARVLRYGAGHPVCILIVAIEGVDEPMAILAPPRNPPAIDEEIAVRLNTTEQRATFWTYAGGR